jgi:hypothetical protein
MPRNLRSYARQTNIQLILGAFILLFLVGLGLIWWRYGSYAALLGFLCLLGGLSPIVLIALILWLMEWISNRANKN